MERIENSRGIKSQGMKYCLLPLIILLLSCSQEDEVPTISQYNMLSFKVLDGVNSQLVEWNSSEDGYHVLSDTISIKMWAGNGLTKSRTDSLFFLLSFYNKWAPQISTLSMSDGKVLEEIPVIPSGNYTGLEYDKEKHSFYAIRFEEKKHFVHIDPVTGQAAQISANPLNIDYPLLEDNTEIIADHNIYAMVVFNASGLQLITVNTLTGETVNAFTLSKTLKGIKYSAASDILYGLFSEDSAHLIHSIGSIDYKNGNESVIKEELFLGEVNGVDFKEEKNEYAILFYDGKSKVMTFSLANNSIQSIIGAEKLGFQTLDYK